jgi:hypothetical protein
MKQLLLTAMSVIALLFMAANCAATGGKAKDIKGGKVVEEEKISAFGDNHKMKQARLKAANKRRVIFNDDGCDLGRIVENYSAENVVKERHAPFVGTDITTVSFSIIEGEAPLYKSKVQPVFGPAHFSSSNVFLPEIAANIQTLMEKGQCPLQIMLDFDHKNNIELFASLRMNDCHDRFQGGWLAKWKINNPHLLVDNTVVAPDMELFVTSLDFTHQQVRDRKIEVIEEVAENYNIDGFEFDYIRHSVLFSRTIQGLPVTKEEVEIINNFMRRIRKLTDKIGVKRGRPILLAVRVPDTFELCLNVGMDVKTWIKEDLIDILIAGGSYSPCSLPVEKIVDFTRKYKVPVYPANNFGSVRAIAPKNFLETTRGLASNWYKAGAEGVYLFNLATEFDQKYGQKLIEIRNKQYKCLDEIGDPAKLIGKNKIFGVDIKKVRSFSYYKFISSPPPLPISLRGPVRYGLLRHIPITIGDDIDEAKEKGFSAKATLIVKANGLVTKNMFDFIFNGQPLKNKQFIALDEKKQEYKFQIEITPSKLRVGKNYLAVWAKYKPKTPKPVEIYSIIIKLEYEKI